MCYLATVISVYNDRKKLNEQLLKSLSKQNEVYEVICIDNRENIFGSAASALNYGASLATTDILVFAHQDIYIKESNGIKKFVEQIKNGEDGNIYGSAGAKEKQKENIGTYTSGLKYSGKIIRTDWKSMEVSCVDECFFGMKKATFDNHPFDEKLCDNWHLYCVEMCLNARKMGNKVIVVPMQMHHFSKGTVTWEYMKCLKLLSQKYNVDFKYLWTTVYKVPANMIYINMLLCLWFLKHKMFG